MRGVGWEGREVGGWEWEGGRRVGGEKSGVGGERGRRVGGVGWEGGRRVGVGGRYNVIMGGWEMKGFKQLKVQWIVL